ncbi:integrator complex subunit 15 isoform X2 [Macaca mulatta]
MSDIRHSLLRRDALSAAKEVLYHLDIYFSSQLQSAPLPIVDKGPVELLEEFVFQVPKERSAQPKRTPVVYCVRLAKALVDDYCCLVPGSIQTLKQIFSASPRFCCQFITSVTALYDLSSDDLIPPMDLLEMIVTWIFEDPRLILITFLNTPIAANLPIGFLELTPLVGLIRWCVKAPLAYKRRKKPPLSNGHVSNKVTKDPGVGMDRDSHLLYSKLHLSVLQVLMTLQLHLTEKNLYGRLGLVLFDHMVPLVEEINRLADELNPLNASQEIELSLDRLAQALQVAMASGALLCTRDDLRTLCSRLPHNKVVVRMRRSGVCEFVIPLLATWRPPQMQSSGEKWELWSDSGENPGLATSKSPHVLGQLPCLLPEVLICNIKKTMGPASCSSCLRQLLTPPPAGDLGSRAAVASRRAPPRVLPPHPHAPAGLRGRPGPPCCPPRPAHAPRAHLHLGRDVSLQAHPLGRPACAFCALAGRSLPRRKGWPVPQKRTSGKWPGGPSPPAEPSRCHGVQSVAFFDIQIGW